VLTGPPAFSRPSVLYQHPLAYLIGLQGIALMRAFMGDYDRDFADARLREIRELLDSAAEFGDGVTTRRITTPELYDAWSAFYDVEANGLLEMDEPVMREILGSLPAGRALDAACGTGRYAALLAALGHEVTGVDISPGMIALARVKVPDGDFRLGDLTQLPMPADAVDLVVCALALTHVPELAPVLAEFARVLRPGGNLVLCDSRLRYPLVMRLPDGSYGYVPHYRRVTSEYLAAAIPLGLQVRRCEELRAEWSDPNEAPPPVRVTPEHPAEHWTLSDWYPVAALGAQNGDPILIFWQFQLESR
jgi:ubiquinone/menaquinone biosynthesis C-methylase UbiE